MRRPRVRRVPLEAGIDESGRVGAVVAGHDEIDGGEVAEGGVGAVEELGGDDARPEGVEGGDGENFGLLVRFEVEVVEGELEGGVSGRLRRTQEGLPWLSSKTSRGHLRGLSLPARGASRQRCHSRPGYTGVPGGYDCGLFADEKEPKSNESNVELTQNTIQVHRERIPNIQLLQIVRSTDPPRRIVPA